MSVEVPPIEEADHPKPVHSPPEHRSSSALRPLGWTIASIGLAALGTGAAFGIAGLVNKGNATQNDDCVIHEGAINCNAVGTADLYRARQDMIVADTGYAVGGALLVTGGILLFANWLQGADKHLGQISSPRVVRARNGVGVDFPW